MAGAPGHRPQRRIGLADPVREAIDVTPKVEKERFWREVKHQLWIWAGFWLSGFCMGAYWAWWKVVDGF